MSASCPVSMTLPPACGQRQSVAQAIAAPALHHGGGSSDLALLAEVASLAEMSHAE